MIASATTTGTQLLRANTESSSIPIATKKMPDRTSRNGARSAVICCAYSLAPRISPARNAPRAYDTPIRWLSHAMPKQVVRVDSSRSSGLRAEAITCSRRGMRYCMRMNVIPSSSAARAMAPARLCATSTGEPPPIGRRIIIGTTLRSCMIRMPTVRRPGSVSTRPCCMRLFRTTAVLLSAMMHPRKIAVRSGHPKNAPATIAVTSVSTICRLPPQNHVPETPERRGVELEPESEHEKEDADLRQQPDRVAPGDQPEAVRTEQDARHEVSDDRRQPKAGQKKEDGAGDGQQDDEQSDQIDGGGHDRGTGIMVRTEGWPSGLRRRS